VQDAGPYLRSAALAAAKTERRILPNLHSRTGLHR